MPKYNTTGVPTVDLLLPRGCLSIAALDDNDNPKGFVAVGNVTEFKITPTTEVLDHYGSCGPISTLDASIITKTELKASFKTDEASIQNISKFLLGAPSGSATNAAVAGFSAWAMVPDGALTLGATYPIFNSAGVRAMNLDSSTPTNVGVVTNESTPVSMVKGTDYTVDYANGTIFILPTSTVVATAIAAGKGLKVNIVADSTAGTLTTTTANTEGAKNYALMFKGINPADNNKESILRVFKVQLNGSGDLALILEKAWSEMAFEGKVMKSQATEALAAGGYLAWEQPT